MNKNIAGALMALILTGCATTSGPDPILGPKGPLQSSNNNNLINKFKVYAEASYANPGDPASARAMAQTGFALIYANCSEFFLGAGETQKWLYVTKDSIGLLGTVASGVIALHNGNATKAGAIALGTSAAFSGIDIYAKNFLFSAENISAVRALTAKALVAHSDAVLISGPMTYESASVALLDNQQFCSPMSITALVREAIQKGEIVASQDPTETQVTIQKPQDLLALRALGSELNPPIVSMDQAGALWWLFMESSDDKERKEYIKPKLASLKTAVLDDELKISPSIAQDKIFEALQRLSPSTQQFLSNTVASTKAAIAAHANQLALIAERKKAGLEVPAAAPSPPPIPSFQSAPLNRTSTHFNVSVK